MLRRIILSLVILVNYAVPVSYGNDINGLISEFKSQTCCSSVSAVVYDHGELTYYEDNSSLYQIGSMTKSFTALLADSSSFRTTTTTTESTTEATTESESTKATEKETEKTTKKTTQAPVG